MSYSMTDIYSIVYVGMAYDNDLIAIGTDKEVIKKITTSKENEDPFVSTLVGKYSVKEKDGCYVFEWIEQELFGDE